MRLTGRGLVAIAGLCLLPVSAQAGLGKAALGFNLGIDFPPGGHGLSPGGVWHVVAVVPVKSSWSLAFELGTEANCVDSRYLLDDEGEIRESTIHAVSTLGVLARYELRSGGFRPYLAAGVHYYTAWDDVKASALSPAEMLITATGFGPHAGVGAAVRLGSHWDLIGEGLYYAAPDDKSEAGFAAVRGGIWFFFGKRSPPA